MLAVSVTMMAKTVDECFEQAKEIPGADVTELGSEELKMAAAFMPQMAEMFSACEGMRTVEVSDDTGDAALALVICFIGDIDGYVLIDQESDYVWMRMDESGQITGMLVLSVNDKAASIMEMIINMTPDEFAAFAEKFGN